MKTSRARMKDVKTPWSVQNGGAHERSFEGECLDNETIKQWLQSQPARANF